MGFGKRRWSSEMVSGRGTRGRSSRSEAEKKHRGGIGSQHFYIPKYKIKTQGLKFAKSMIYSLQYSAAHLP